MELTTRPRLTSDQRCPYCHDLLAQVQEPIRCEGCGTEHHAECVRELGRCTTLGCERPLEVDEGAYSVDPAIRRAIRRRFRQRAKRFVERNVRQRPSDQASDAERVGEYRRTRREVRQLLSEHRYDQAKTELERLEARFAELPPGRRKEHAETHAYLADRVRAAGSWAFAEDPASHRRAVARVYAFAWAMIAFLLSAGTLGSLTVLLPDSLRSVFLLLALALSFAASFMAARFSARLASLPSTEQSHDAPEQAKEGG